jgi:hypothetical protein
VALGMATATATAVTPARPHLTEGVLQLCAG